MISIKTDLATGYRNVSSGVDWRMHGNAMVDQYIAILFGWALGIYEAGR